MDDALALATLVRERKVSPLELVDQAIARIERVNPRINAVVTTMFEQARQAAGAALPDGPFRGVPFLIKDLDAACAGVRMTAGSRYFSTCVPGHDSTLVQRYRRAGLVIVGKTNTPELGLTPVTESALLGPAHTPWKPGYTSGGSSGGSAAAVAAGLVPMAHGGDGGGSLRIPASCCGVFGLKPSRARTPAGPDRSDSWNGFVVQHAITVSVRDSAALLDATHGPETTSPYHAPPVERSFLEETRTPSGILRVAMTKRPHLPGTLHPDCAAAVDDAARLLEQLGHRVDEVDIDIDATQFARDFFLLVCVETAATIVAGAAVVGRQARSRDFEAPTWICGMLGRQHTALQAAQAKERLHTLARKVSRFFDDHDVLLCPTLASPPVRIGSLLPRGAEAFAQAVIARANLGFVLRLPGVLDATLARVFAFMPFTPLANVTGQPAMSVPLYWNGDGLPIGCQFTARFGAEGVLFRLAAQLEQARPWAGRQAPVS